MRTILRLTLVVFTFSVSLTFLGEYAYAISPNPTPTPIPWQIPGTNPVNPPERGSPSPFGEIVGKVEIIPGIAATSDFVPRVSSTGTPDGFRVIIEGIPTGVTCDAYGNFVLRRVPVGQRTLIVFPPNYDFSRDPEYRSATRVKVGVMSAVITDAGTIVVTKPGSVTGRIEMEGIPTANMASLVIAIPQFGLVTKPNPDGGYLLTGVPPGTWNVRLMGPGLTESRSTTRLTYIVAGNPTLGVDFIIRGVSTQPTQQEQSTQNQKVPDNPGDQKTPAETEKERAVKEILNRPPKKPLLE